MCAPMAFAVGSSRVGVKRNRITRKIYFCRVVSWPGLAPMAFAAGFLVRGRKPAAQNNSEDFIFIMLFRGRAWFVSYGLCG